MVRIFFLPYLGNLSKSDPCSCELFCLESHILSFPKVLQIPPESLCIRMGYSAGGPRVCITEMKKVSRHQFNSHNLPAQNETTVHFSIQQKICYVSSCGKIIDWMISKTFLSSPVLDMYFNRRHLRVWELVCLVIRVRILSRTHSAHSYISMRASPTAILQHTCVCWRQGWRLSTKNHNEHSCCVLYKVALSKCTTLLPGIQKIQGSKLGPKISYTDLGFS